MSFPQNLHLITCYLPGRGFIVKVSEQGLEVAVQTNNNYAKTPYCLKKPAEIFRK